MRNGGSDFVSNVRVTNGGEQLQNKCSSLASDEPVDPFGGAKLRPSVQCVKRRSELALSEVEGVNPEQVPTFMLGSRRVE